MPKDSVNPLLMKRRMSAERNCSPLIINTMLKPNAAYLESIKTILRIWFVYRKKVNKQFHRELIFADLFIALYAAMLSVYV